MANWHALTGSMDGNSYQIAYHVPIPSANNRSGINYRTALVNSGLGGTTILRDGDGTGGTISSAEKTSILAGSLLEVVQQFAVGGGSSKTLAQLTAEVDAIYTALANTSGSFIVGIQNQLLYWGGSH